LEGGTEEKKKGGNSPAVWQWAQLAAGTGVECRWARNGVDPVSVFAGEGGIREEGIGTVGKAHRTRRKKGLSYSHPCKKHKLIVVCAYGADAGAFFRFAG